MSSYHETKQEVAALVHESGNDREKHQLREILAREQVFIQSSNPERIEAVVSELGGMRFRILMRTPDFLVGMFDHLCESRVSMNDQVQAKQLIENGRASIRSQDWDDVRQVIGRLWSLLPDEDRSSGEFNMLTGIV